MGCCECYSCRVRLSKVQSQKLKQNSGLPAWYQVSNLLCKRIDKEAKWGEGFRKDRLCSRWTSSLACVANEIVIKIRLFSG
jgi:hypothetical protein